MNVTNNDAALALGKIQHNEGRLHAQARILARQVQRSPYSVILAAGVVVYAILPFIPAWLAFTWLGAVAVALVTRLIYARRVSPLDESSNANEVLYNLTWFAFFNGLAVGLSAPLFFYAMPDASRAIVAMVLIGLAAGGIATSAAYPPVFLAYILPALLPLAVSWALVGHTQYYLIGVLIVSFIIILYGFVQENKKVFDNSYFIRHERDQVVQQLEAKHAELLLAMQEAQIARESAEEAGQAKARVLAAASHDLRQPLHALSLYSAVLSQQPDTLTLSEVSKQIDLSVRALSALLNALLDISRLDAGVYQIESTSFSVHDVLSRIVQEFQPLAQNKGLMLYLDCRPLYTHSDPVVFERIARNLIDNALKYTEHGAVLVAATLEGDQICVSVRDTGKGIPAPEQARIFEEFYQLDNPSRNRELGLGLGLSIVKRLAELIKSHVSLTSVQGEGSCFSWQIPLEARMGVAETRAGFHDEEVLAMSSRVQVLVIEDEAAIRHGMGLLLRTWGMEAHGCATLASAQEILRQQAMDIIIADLRLQDGANGLDVVQSLREEWNHLPVLLISGETDPAKLRDVAASGLPLMNKPIQAEMLRKNLAQLLERSS